MEQVTLYNISPDALKQLFAEAVSMGFEQGRREAPKKETELPVPRSEAMIRLGLKDVRSFNARVKADKVKSCGRIGREPSYLISEFFKR